MTPDCMVCRGACCETLLLPGSLGLDEEWAAARGLKRFIANGYYTSIPAIEAPCPCPKLSPMGACSIYETRPQVCRAYPVGGPSCLGAITRRRTPEKAREILGDEYFGNVTQAPGQEKATHAIDCPMGEDCTCTFDVPEEPA